MDSLANDILTETSVLGASVDRTPADDDALAGRIPTQPHRHSGPNCEIYRPWETRPWPNAICSFSHRGSLWPLTLQNLQCLWPRISPGQMIVFSHIYTHLHTRAQSLANHATLTFTA